MMASALFLGFPLKDPFLQALTHVNNEIYRLFVGQGSSYLQEFTYEDQKYLGKVLGKEIDVEMLRTAEQHIYSLLKKLTPEYSFQETSLLLIPIHE